MIVRPQEVQAASPGPAREALDVREAWWRDQRRGVPSGGLLARRRYRRTLAVLAALLWLGAAAGAPVTPAAPAGSSLTGVVTHVGDGDTLWVRVDGRGGKPWKLRLHGIDAPESCQPWGAQSAAALRARVLQRRVLVVPRMTDDYGRTVARIELDGEDVGAWLVRQGHAWNGGFARRAGPYAAEQREAQAVRSGLFADTAAIEPRLFRARHGACR